MNVNDDLPLHEANFFILLSLARAPKHGYALLQDVAELSNDRLQLSTGTLYGALRRMLDSGWVERFDDTSEVADRPARQAYRITDLGQRILNADAARLEELPTAVHGKLA